MTISEFLITMGSVLLTSLTTNYLLQKMTGTSLSRNQLFFMWVFSGAFLVLIRPYIQPNPEATGAEQTVVTKSLIEREINFKDNEPAIEEIRTAVTTQFGNYLFSNYGASLIESDAYQQWNTTKQILRTVDITQERHERSFIVALKHHATPYYYTLVSHEKDENKDILKYRTELSSGALIEKQFVVHHHEPYIDCIINLKQTSAAPEQLRLIVTGPYLKELHYDNISAAFSARYGQRKLEVISDLEAAASTIIEKPELIGTENRYFAHFLLSDKERLTESGGFIIIDGTRTQTIIQSKLLEKNATEWTLRFYWGPKKGDLLRAADRRADGLLNMGWLAFISRPLSAIMLALLHLIVGFTKNFGLAIILLTLLLKLLLLPFTLHSKQALKQQLKKQQDFQKKLAYIQEQYKNDREALAKARADLITSQGLPSMSNILPMLFQIPFIVALSWVLSNSVELYKAPFLWVPDLSSHDPYYIIPLLVVGGMLAGVPLVTENQQRISLLVMTCLLAAVSAQLPAGLALYFLVSGAFGTLQTAFLQRA